ncbi:uncharacterized protein N7515_003574 [Penicillium bovifimosum]|uniref:Uncharacterized protein n=1 Tax=Penicillium bovifimosum TaxID=126998 RepID=A0A9W9H6S4_9EURO|nr:uncharacterized protein N7515_003574 [Penicillium bovifimosum]KAJ5138726.1 hypothetical protein N7515_003574 [Penicillium bovifimosum]
MAAARHISTLPSPDWAVETRHSGRIHKSPSQKSPGAWRSFWLSGANESEWDAEERARRRIPDYCAPLVYFYSGEQFWPGDIAEHLYHNTPTLNYTPIQSQWDHLMLRDLND